MATTINVITARHRTDNWVMILLGIDTSGLSWIHWPQHWKRTDIHNGTLLSADPATEILMCLHHDEVDDTSTLTGTTSWTEAMSDEH